VIGWTLMEHVSIYLLNSQGLVLFKVVSETTVRLIDLNRVYMHLLNSDRDALVSSSPHNLNI